METKEFCALVLAAGKGTRMKSEMAKVLHVLCGKPLLHYSLEAARAAGASKIVVIVGHQSEKVQEAFGGSDLVFVEQKPQLGTGHAVMQAGAVLKDYPGMTVILCGDVPLLKPETIRSLIEHHLKAQADVTVLTTEPPGPHAYGRIVKNDRGEVLKIVEHKDATEAQRQILEINTGIYCVDTHFLFDALSRVKNDNQQKEYYLTDIVEIAREDGKKVHACLTEDYYEVMGINTLEELAKAAECLGDRRWAIGGWRGC
ncbi:MAG: NTP transferase domain-containing protein [Syntrophaceae bacterium]|jgi:UDP-N-acetylglucosamine diphosphorylase/glucosamine-1-phosphate N-acetyltransferase|nr:NTP transferase domain-containing protein [Syntrophaceae bacterium]